MALPQTTTAGVQYFRQMDFEDAFPGVQIWEVSVKFDGPALGGVTEIRFPGTATPTQKRAAVRNLVNQMMRGDEPSAPLLTDAAIQISGQPV